MRRIENHKTECVHQKRLRPVVTQQDGPLLYNTAKYNEKQRNTATF